MSFSFIVHRRIVGSVAAVAAAACLVLGAPTAASAAAGGGSRAVVISEHRITDSGDACGIPVQITGHTTTVFAGGSKIPIITSGRITFTAENGKSVTIGFAEVDQFQLVDNGDGTGTVTYTILGSPERISGSGGATSSVDAGRIVITTPIDLASGEPLGPDQVSINGPHPEWDSNGSLFCQEVTAALT